jgi:hypothetical protein
MSAKNVRSREVSSESLHISFVSLQSENINVHCPLDHKMPISIDGYEQGALKGETIALAHASGTLDKKRRIRMNTYAI